MTEDEAKTKWCPQAFKPFHIMKEDGVLSMCAVNPRPDTDKPSMCIASDCAMWAWFFGGPENEKHGRCGLIGAGK